MFLHLGQNTIVPERDVIGIFDLDNTTCSQITRVFLSEAEKADRVAVISEELPKSFILCGKSEDFVVYLSQLSSQTLLKRSGNFSMF